MKKTITYYFTFFLLAILAGCKKNDMPDASQKVIDIGQKVKFFLLAAEAPKDGMINIQAFKQAGSLIPQDQQAFDGYVGGTFYINKDDTKSTTISKFSINGFDIPYNNYPAYPGYGIQSNGNGTVVIDWMKNLFGKKINISLQGSTLYRTNIEDSNFYVPKEITYTAEFLQSRTYNANNSNTITWQTDPDNPNGMLYVGIVYEAVKSNEEDQSMPDNSYVQAFLEVPDNGSYTITSDKVTELPTNSYVSVTLARGNYQLLTDSATGTQTLVYAISQSSTSSTIKIVR